MENDTGIKLNKHPEYSAWAKKSQIYKDLYEGEHDILVSKDYLWPHLLELKPDYGAQLRTIREMRTRYTNYVEAIVSAIISLMFRNNPNYQKIENVLPENEIKNINGKGQHLNTFIQLVARDYLVYGRPFIFVDNYNVKVETKRQERAAGVRPIMEILCPLAVKDWEIETENFSKYGEFKFLRHEYDYIPSRTNEKIAPKIVRRSMALRLEDSNYKYLIYESNREQNQIIEEGKETWKVVTDATTIEKIGVIPVCTIWDQDSWIKDVSEEALRAFNLGSTYDNILNNQAYQRSFIAGNISDENWKNIGESVVGRLPEGASVFTIEAANTTSIKDRLLSSINDLFKIGFNQSRSLPVDSGVAESAKTLRERKEELHALLESSIEELESVMNNALKFYAMFKGIKDYDGKIELSCDVSAEDVEEQIKIYSAFRDRIAKYPTWQKETDKKFVDLQGLPVSDKIKKEIDAGVELKINSIDNSQPQTIRARLQNSLGENDAATGNNRQNS